MEQQLTNAQKRSERVRLANLKGTHTNKEWQEMIEFFNYTCVKCNGESGLMFVEKDHIIPLYQGGSNSIKNIQPLCAKCNASKSTENIDWRLIFCEKYNLSMRKEWYGTSN